MFLLLSTIVNQQGTTTISPTTQQANLRLLPDSVERFNFKHRNFWKIILLYIIDRRNWGVFWRFGLWQNLFALPHWCADVTKAMTRAQSWEDDADSSLGLEFTQMISVCVSWGVVLWNPKTSSEILIDPGFGRILGLSLMVLCIELRFYLLKS